MLITRPTIAAIVLAVTGADALGCYTSGLGFPNIDQAKSHIYRACFGYAGSNGEHIRGAFENVWFKANSESNLPATVCVNELGYKIEMQITNRAGGRTIGSQEAYNGLIDLAGCLRGGEGQTSNAWFRVDPNEGSC